jgi:hypothetical protein
MEPEPLDQSSALYLETNEAPKDTVVWQRGGRGSETSRGTGDAGDVLTKDFLRKYIHYARSRVKPVLSEEAMEAISSAYAEMRSKQTPKNLPVTARSLETIIRLASAHAKSRLSSVVEESDVEEVLELLNFVLFHEIGDFTSAASTSSGTKQTRRRGLEPEEDATSGDDDDNDEDAVSKRRRLVAEEDEGAAMEAVSVDRESTRYQLLQSIVMKIGNSTGIVIPASSRYLLTGEVVGVFAVCLSGTDAIATDAIFTRLNASSSSGSGPDAVVNKFSRAEMHSMLVEMEKENKVSEMAETAVMYVRILIVCCRVQIMYQDDEVHIIL